MSRERAGYVTLGVGVGALADGFVLHQLLQWHHLVSARTTDETVSGLEKNTLADGIFHLTSLGVLLVGLLLLAGGRLDPRRLVAFGLVGWGAFNVADQLVFHLALGAHHIREDAGNQELYDWGFFAFGLALIAGGVVLARSGGRRSEDAAFEETPVSMRPPDG